LNIKSKYPFKVTIAQLILLVLPTIAIICVSLFRLNNYYSILENNYISQTTYFSIGIIASVLFHRFNFRFITAFLILLFINSIIYQLLQRISVGEFDAFFVSVKFYIFSILVLLGWAIGFALIRSKLLVIIWLATLIFAEIIAISKTSDFQFENLIQSIIPSAIYLVYILFSIELLNKLIEDSNNLFKKIFKRFALFAALVVLFLIFTFNLFKPSFQAIEKEWGGGSSSEKKEGKNSGESMTEKGKGGGIKNKDQTKLAGNLNKDKQLVFVAKLNHFFRNSNIPNPLYFTANYYTKFDTATQTFEMDPSMPFNDLFIPDPSKIALYFKKTDSSIIRKSLGNLNREVVTTEVYKVAMAPESFVAPSNAFYCQPISVPDEFKKNYKSAYVAKMWVSSLNSAYFIYNPAGNKVLENFQEERFSLLRNIQEIKGPDEKFMDYYTYMPSNSEYARISKLADSVTRDFVAPIDKVIAIRNYFLAKDEFKQPLFKYTDNPGVPGLPSANKLNYFLFENRKGYCAYFAGATLFMLRSLKIPSRIAVGYLAEDRSSKNPGWYWFYQDQAHAWVQVYFQDYGWIDFDTTIPDVNTQQASQPDGTPPPDIPTTYLVIDGKVTKVDTLKKTLDVITTKFLYHDTEFVAKREIEVLNDVSLANIHNDTGAVALSAIKIGENVTLVSSAEVFKTIYITSDDDAEKIMAKLKQPLPIDEVKLMKKIEKEENKSKSNSKKKPFDWMKLLNVILIVIVLGLILTLSLPLIIFNYYRVKANKLSKGQAAASLRGLLFYLNQLDALPNHVNAPEERVYLLDKRFGTDFKYLNLIYQKAYYSTNQLNDNETMFLKTAFNIQLSRLSKSFTFKQKFLGFLNLKRTINYYKSVKA
jgi:transglutaminase-like putative cysteine protease